MIRRFSSIVFLILAAGLWAGCNEKPQPAPPPPPKPKRTNDVAVIKTSDGEMVFELWPDVALKTVANFKKLANSHFYDGTAFHRIVKDFVVQGGDPMTKSPALEDHYGEGNPGYSIKAEFNDRPHERGVLSMARGQDPDSAGSQFFIVLKRAPSLDRQYTAFGKLIKGDDVLTKISETPVGPNRDGEMSKPKERVGVASIRVLPENELTTEGKT